MAQQTVTVPVKPASESKINWTQIAALGASLGTFFGLSLDPQTLVAVILGIQAAGNIVTVLLRTFGKPSSATPQQVG